MEFTFKGKLRKQLETDKAMQKAFGANRAKPLKRRLNELRYARTLDDVERDPPPKCHELTGDEKGKFAVTVTGNWRLIFEPDPFVKGHVNLAEVRRIRLLELKDYH